MADVPLIGITGGIIPPSPQPPPLSNKQEDNPELVTADSFGRSETSLANPVIEKPSLFGLPAPDLCSKGDQKHEQAKDSEFLPPEKCLPLPLTRQAFYYDCGPDALQSVLMYYGEEYVLSELMEMCHTTPEGTNPRDIVRVARELGFEVEMKENLTVDDLKKAYENKVPVIIDCQAWRDGEDLQKPWSEVWDSGHYMSVIGVDDNYVYFMDPSLLGSRGVIPRKEFEERWHDIDEKKYFQSGIFIYGKKPSPPPAYIHVMSDLPQCLSSLLTENDTSGDQYKQVK
jgi:predicted double-glycine peptidase